MRGDLLGPVMVQLAAALLEGAAQQWRVVPVGARADQAEMGFSASAGVGVFAGWIGTWLRHRHTLRRCADTATSGILIALGLRLTAEQ
ncbi:hypothetical protein [Micromonospora rubida]